MIVCSHEFRSKVRHCQSTCDKIRVRLALCRLIARMTGYYDWILLPLSETFSEGSVEDPDRAVIG
ncbi:hypothetical protein RIEGSTA812A_PEG_578 [invertebrate metagenome]|uniref:Uncharacterized protein n=1 Tax=invertebrate metagenome TaxID=1711999 RepID=A0A484H6V7_9ZZZZ